MIFLVFLLGCGMIFTGILLAQWFLMPLVGLTFYVIITNIPFLNILGAVLSCLVAPVLMVYGALICFTIIWFGVGELTN